MILNAFVVVAMLNQTAMIDLVTHPPKPDMNRAVQYRFGTHSFGSPKPKPLPLDVEIQSASVDSGQQRSLIVEISIKNDGERQYMFPVGGDADLVLAPRNRSRWQARFFLKRTGERIPSMAGPVTFGSADVPQSEVAIPPGGAVRVRLRAYFESEEERRWKAAPNREIDIQAGFTLLPYADDPNQYIIDQTDAPEVVSTNSVRVQLK